MSYHWHKDESPRWDADKQRIFGDAELAATGLRRPADGAAMADEWWRVLDDEGAVVGYGWLDSEWGDAQISFLVSPDERGEGVGAFVVDHLEDEARRRGLNYIYNVVPEMHPDRAWMTSWLTAHGFTDNGDDLRRQVRSVMQSGTLP